MSNEHICAATSVDPRVGRHHEAVRCELPEGHAGGHRSSIPQEPYPPMLLGWTTAVPIGKLAAKWREESEGLADAGYQCALINCADELALALSEARQRLGISIDSEVSL
ncbi:hypothetical protein [Rhodococcus sp. IEGM 1330]|uniref:hypothetical protein n=1 Tax=Rhodococcus sp. IEGM 1330 TaxID=3082225 RepID=UPI002954BE2A|nr:hypothetical protein [Rhodococcus sp. IEGM 1330]MDV8022286.1 hypothetical protein [Rhodococcus sp. IEGM 1330]